jgi:hypothetical protein
MDLLPQLYMSKIIAVAKLTMQKVLRISGEEVGAE